MGNQYTNRHLGQTPGVHNSTHPNRTVAGPTSCATIDPQAPLSNHASHLSLPTWLFNLPVRSTAREHQKFEHDSFHRLNDLLVFFPAIIPRGTSTRSLLLEGSPIEHHGRGCLQVLCRRNLSIQSHHILVLILVVILSCGAPLRDL